ncbi:MAG: class II aldolase/adducin family protein [Anaerolineaceae bacterium]|nr:class II aldolase/adducin family protein [Anaerolineaceae bacterium]
MENFDNQHIKLCLKVARLYYQEQLTSAEIRNQLGISHNEVSSLLMEARENHLVDITIKSEAEIVEAQKNKKQLPGESSEEGDVRESILRKTNELYAKGWITGIGGNISARTTEDPNHVWITPAGIFKGDLTPDMMVKIDLNGNCLNQTSFSPSSEYQFHCAIYHLRPDVHAIVHTHAPYATLMGLTKTAFQPISAESVFFGDVPISDFRMPGSKELAEEIVKTLGYKGIACILQNHGLVVCGTNIRKAVDMTEIIELSAEKILFCRMLGIDPALVPDEAVKKLSEMGKLYA